MSWDWVPPREGEDAQGGPSPALRRAVTVLIVAFTAVLALYYATQVLGVSREECDRNRPQGVSSGSVETRWRWWPPGTECVYPGGEQVRA